MTENFVAYRLVIDYSFIIGNNQWLINWLSIDYPLIILWCHWCHRCHRLDIPGIIQPTFWFDFHASLHWRIFQTSVAFHPLFLIQIIRPKFHGPATLPGIGTPEERPKEFHICRCTTPLGARGFLRPASWLAGDIGRDWKPRKTNLWHPRVLHYPSQSSLSD